MRSAAACLLAVAALSAAPAGATENPVVAAAERTAASTSLTFTVRSVVDTPASGRYVYEGTVVQLGSSVSWKLDFSVDGVRSPTINVIGLLESGRYLFYLRLGSQGARRLGLPAGKIWLRLNAGQAADFFGGGLFSSIYDTSQSVDPLRYGVVSSTKRGVTRISGRQMTRYRVVVDVQRAGAKIPSFKAFIDRLEKDAGRRLSRMTQEVWIDKVGRLARVTTTHPTLVDNQEATARVTITFVSYAQSTRITPPPPATAEIAPP